MRILLLVIVAVVLTSCNAPKYVNVNKKHNYYCKHRSKTYTAPVWVPGQGVLLETHKVIIIKKHKH